VASGRLLGFVCLGMAPLIMAVWWKLAFGRVGWFILLYAIVLAAAALNASTWLAAILFGRTRQLRSSWLALMTVLAALVAAGAVWPDLAHDFSVIAMVTLLVLGFPSSMIIYVVASQGPLPHLPWGLERAIPAAVTVGLLAFAYLQPFVLLPRIFRWRAERERGEV
jgi:hypothetical protein